MEWTIIGTNTLYAVIGVVPMYLSYRIIDRLTPQVDFAQRVEAGDVAVATLRVP